ncbi:S-layer homology domain-containing protein [Bacillus bombysepticus]
MKNKLIAAGIVTGTLLSFPSGIFADSISKVTNPSQNTIESMKLGENLVVGVITDADTYYATVEYTDSEGKKQTVDIDFPNADNSNFKTGDTVKVANKDKWKHKKIGMHNATIASADSISKVTNPSQNTIESMKLGENFVVGVITDAGTYYATVEYNDSEGKKQTVDIDFPNADNSNFKTGDTVKVANKDKWKHKKIGMHNATIASADSISKVNQSVAQTDKLQNNTTQPFIEKNNKRTGKVIEKGSNYLVVKQGDVNIKTNVRKKVLENINIGDTVHIYAESFMGSNLPIKEQILYAEQSIVQKVGEPIDSNYIKFTGEVVSKNGNVLGVSNGKMEMSAKTSSKVIEEINIGDTVNIYTTTVVGGMIGSSLAGSSVIEK